MSRGSTRNKTLRKLGNAVRAMNGGGYFTNEPHAEVRVKRWISRLQERGVRVHISTR